MQANIGAEKPASYNSWFETPSPLIRSANPLSAPFTTPTPHPRTRAYCVLKAGKYVARDREVLRCRLNVFHEFQGSIGNQKEYVRTISINPRTRAAASPPESTYPPYPRTDLRKMGSFSTTPPLSTAACSAATLSRVCFMFNVEI